MPLTRIALLKLARLGLLEQLKDIDAEIAGSSVRLDVAIDTPAPVKRKRKGWSPARRAAFKRMKELKSQKKSK